MTTSGTTAKERAAAIEHVDEADAVACEAVEHVLTLARRADPAYPGERAWRVAKQLAAAVLTVTPADPAAARALLLAAITDRRLIRAANPIGLLIRGVVGTENGADRYLLPSSASPERPTPPRAATTSYTTSTGLPPGLHEALLSALRGREHLSEEWLRERDIPARAVTIARAEVIREEPTSMTPLADALERQDPDAYRARLERILPDLELPAILHVERTLTHPLLLGMCRARLETQLQAPAEGRS